MCDCISILNAYNLYESMKESGHFSRRPREDEGNWARKNALQINRLREVEKLKSELTSRLHHMNIACNRDVILNPPNATGMDSYNIDDASDVENNHFILKLMIAGAFYPNYFNSIPLDVNESMRMIGCHDMRNTVVVKNLPRDEAVLYTKQLTEMFQVCAESLQVS